MTQIPFDQQPNQTLARALAVMEAFANGKPDKGIRELSRELKINSATVYRVVATLANEGYLEQNPATQRYALGPKVLHLASSYSRHNPISVVARKVFESFSDRFEHNFYLGKLSHFDVVYMAVLDGRGPMRIVVTAGEITALHATAAGKLLLAYQDDVFIEEFLHSSHLKPLTERTIVSPEELWEQIKKIRSDGYAVNDGELYEDVSAVAVPLHDVLSGHTMAVSLAYPRHLAIQGRIAIPDLISLAREIAQEISARGEGLQSEGSDGDTD